MTNFKMEKRVLMALSLVLILFLTSCTGKPAAGERPTDTAAALKQVQSGTLGLQLNFLNNYPPALIYDLNEFDAIIELKNKGNHDIDPASCFIQLTGYDPNIIRGINYVQSCGTIEGKNVYNLEGGFNNVEFKSSNVQLPAQTFEYSPNLNLVACYRYQTKANPLVCVDPLFYQVTSQQKSCLVKDISMGGGQGAPVGIGYTGVKMIGNKAVFEISVVNHGQGRVLSPYSNIQNCGQASIAYTDLDQLSYEVQLSGASLIKCNPENHLVRLTNNQGKIACSFNIPSSSAYETPLLISLDYNYIQSLQKPLKIIKTPT